MRARRVVGPFPSRHPGRLLAALALGACSGGSLMPPTDPPPPPPYPDAGPVAPNRDVDLLFLIDNSSSMRLSQTRLLNAFPVMMDALQALPGGLPDIHIAVVSSDMGAGDGAFAGCDATGGDRGVFQYTPRGDCATAGLAPGETFISNVGGQANYTGNLSDVFTCIAALGETGCGFEHQFAALTRALGADGQPAPPENQGFLRPEATLAIVMISNEDDCSAPAGSQLYDITTSMTLQSPLGPPTNFRCNEFGHLCDGAPPSRFAPAGDVSATKTYAQCVSAEGAGKLLTVADTVARLRSLKPDPDNQIIFAAITGAPAPYTVHWKDPNGGPDTGPWPEITHSCTAADGSFADPAVRTSQLVGQFGPNGLLLSICAGDYTPALQTASQMIIARLQPQ